MRGLAPSIACSPRTAPPTWMRECSPARCTGRRCRQVRSKRISETCAHGQELLERFGTLDHATIPPCWWRRNGHVEALQALRDHERMSYAESWPGQAAMSWRDSLIEMRLREWTAFYGCSRRTPPPIRSARPTDEEAWAAHFGRAEAPSKS